MLFILTLLTTTTSRSLTYFIELARHGARSPSNYLEWDQNRWPDGESILTPEGMRQHYLIGTYLKQRYFNNESLIPEYYNSSTLNLIANEVERTQRSLMSQMIGFYPTHKWKKTLNKNPSVPIKLKNNTFLGNDFVIPTFYLQVAAGNTMLRAKDGCPEYKNYVKNRKNSEGADKIFKKYEETVKKVQEKYKCSFEEAKSITLDVIGSIRCNNFVGYSWDQEFDEKFREEAQKLYMEMKHFSSFMPDNVAKFTAGDFFKGVYEILDKVRKGENGDKGTIFLAHDTTIFSVFSGLGAWTEEQPPFAALLLFEVYYDEIEKIYEVAMIYNMKSIKIPGFGKHLVNLDDFLSYLFSRTPTSFNQSCKDLSTLPITPPSIPTQQTTNSPNLLLSAAVSLSQFTIIFLILSIFLGKFKPS